MGKKEKREAKMTLLEVAEPTVAALRHLYDINVLTREEIKSTIMVDERGRKILCLEIIETEEKINVCTEMFGGLVQKNGIEISQLVQQAENDNKRLLCKVFYD